MNTATRTRIFAAARRVLQNRSAQFVGLREIAADADVSAALIVQLFGSKDELVFEVRLEEVQEGLQKNVAIARLAGTGATALHAFFDAAISLRMATPWVIKDLRDRSWQWSGEQHTRFDRTFAPIIPLIEEAWQERNRGSSEPKGMSARKFGEMAQASFESALHRAFSFNLSVETTQQDMRRTIDTLLGYCGAAPTA